MSDDQAQIEAELAGWRTKLDTLRVRANLLKMEYRDQHDEVVEKLESAYEDAKTRFADFAAATDEEVTNLKAGFTSAWSAFKEAYDGHTEDEPDAPTAD